MKNKQTKLHGIDPRSAWGKAERKLSAAFKAAREQVTKEDFNSLLSMDLAAASRVVMGKYGRGKAKIIMECRNRVVDCWHERNKARQEYIFGDSQTAPSPDCNVKWGVAVSTVPA